MFLPLPRMDPKSGWDNVEVSDLHSDRGSAVTPPVLRLFVSGTSATSQRAKVNLAGLKATGLPADWRTEVIDVLAEPARAEKAGILATPTLSYEEGGRQRRIVGDLSDAVRVLNFLGLDEGRAES
jgi:circadian clock protein KaiB